MVQQPLLLKCDSFAEETTSVILMWRSGCILGFTLSFGAQARRLLGTRQESIWGASVTDGQHKGAPGWGDSYAFDLPQFQEQFTHAIFSGCIFAAWFEATYYRADEFTITWRDLANLMNTIGAFCLVKARLYTHGKYWQVLATIGNFLQQSIFVTNWIFWQQLAIILQQMPLIRIHIFLFCNKWVLLATISSFLRANANVVQNICLWNASTS